MPDDEEKNTKPLRATNRGSSIKLRIDQEMMHSLNDIRHELRLQTRNDVVINSLQAYRILFEASADGKYVLLFDPSRNSYEQVSVVNQNKGFSAPPILISPVEARNQAIIYTRVLIESLKDILKDDKSKHHNDPPLDLRIPYGAIDTKDIKNLIAELRKLNRLLEKGSNIDQVSDKEKIEAAKHINKFLDAFAGTAGKGTGYLFVAAGLSLLTYLGVSTDVPQSILNKIK